MAWRPSLRSLLIGINLIVLVLPLAGVQLLRLYESALVRQTESALIAQAAFIAAFYRSLIIEEGTQDWMGASRSLPADTPARSIGTTAWIPQPPQLDLASSPTLAPFPDGFAGHAPDNLASRVGERLMPVLKDAQLTTLAGIRVVDPWGVIVASTGDDTGLSIAHGEEIHAALSGNPMSTIRRKSERVRDTAFDSISRTSRIRAFVSSPIVLHGRLIGAVMLSRTPPSIVQTLYGKRWLLVQGVALLLTLVVIMSLLTFRLIDRPIRKLAEQASRITDGTLTAAELRHAGNAPRIGEIARLNGAILAMADTLEQRANYLQEFSRHVSHEFKTPISSIRATIELLEEHGVDMDAAQRQKFLHNIEADAARLHRLTERLMALTRAEMTTEASNPIDVVSIVHQVAGDYASELSFELPEQNDVITALAPAATLSAALDTLFENAIEHGASKVNVNCAIGQQTVQIEVRDNGHGISQRNRPRIFDPFFTTRRDHGGTGLGLNIARTLVRQANGDLSLAEDEETTFVIHLPAKTPGN